MKDIFHFRAQESIPKLCMLLCTSFLWSCSRESPTQTTSPSDAITTPVDSIYWFHLTDYPKINLTRFSVSYGYSRYDTIISKIIPLDSLRDSVAELSQNGILRGYQIKNKDGGILYQHGFDDTLSDIIQFQKPFFQVMPVMQVYTPVLQIYHPSYKNSGKTYYDTVQATFQSKGGTQSNVKLISYNIAELIRFGGLDNCIEINKKTRIEWESGAPASFSDYLGTYCPGYGLMEERMNYTISTRLL